MKKHLLITAALLLASCRTDKEILHTTDTVFIAKYHYDSVIIDRYTTTENKGDTVLVDRLTTEYRYRLHTDTMHHYHTDTVCTTIYKEAPDKGYDMLPWIIIGVVLVGGQLVKKQIKKIF